MVLCCSSSQASTVIPIFSGVGQVLGLTQQTVVQAFNFGDAITNLITPVSTVLMASLGFAGTPWTAGTSSCGSGWWAPSWWALCSS